MNRFSMVQPKTFARAAQAIGAKTHSLPVIKAGGMDLVDRMKEGLDEPDLLVDVNRIRSREPISTVLMGDRDAISLEPTATLATIASSDVVLREAPALAEAAGSAATPQVRNVATAAGNLLQRPRCWYYRMEQYDCRKKGGTTCFAIDGENKFHAVFGGGICNIVHPSNLAVPLSVSGAEIHTVRADGSTRSMPIAKLFHAPYVDVMTEHGLADDEVIERITLRPAPASGFYAIKEKQTFDWPLVMAAVALELDGRTIRSARVCAGAVAPIPWMLPAVAAALAGVSVDDDDALRDACASAGDGATPLRDNVYKLKLLPVAVRRAVKRAAGEREED